MNKSYGFDLSEALDFWEENNTKNDLARIIRTIGVMNTLKLYSEFGDKQIRMPRMSTIIRQTIPLLIEKELKDLVPDSETYSKKLGELAKRFQMPKEHLIKIWEEKKYICYFK